MGNAAASAKDIEKAAAAAEKEMQKLANVRMKELNSDLKGVDSELQSIEKEIAATKARILELNEQDLNELAGKFGTTADAIKTELERQITAGGKDAGDMSAKELERAMERAIAQIRNNLRRAGEEIEGVMPSSAELAELGRLFGVVAAQSSVLATAPDSVELLTDKYEELVARAKELNAMRGDIQQELGDLQSGMESAATALTDASSEIQQIPFDIKDALQDLTISDGTFANIESSLDKTVGHLKSIETILKGKFVNQ
jgi:chromosome segregation ATPase